MTEKSCKIKDKFKLIKKVKTKDNSSFKDYKQVKRKGFLVKYKNKKIKHHSPIILKSVSKIYQTIQKIRIRKNKIIR